MDYVILEQKDGYVLVKSSEREDFYRFGTWVQFAHRNDPPDCQQGTLAQVQSELTRWRDQMDEKHPERKEIGRIFLEVLERKGEKQMDVCEEKVTALLETMEEKKNYRVYEHDSLSEGKRLSMDHDVSCEGMDLSELAALDKDALEEMSRISGAMEQKTLRELQGAFQKWERQAAVTQAIHRAQEYQKTPEILHTENQWRKNPRNSDMEEISNRVYKMYDRVYEDTAWSYEKKQLVPVAWEVTWGVFVQSPKRPGYASGVKIAGQENKKFTEETAAMKYLEGRKKAYAHLFTEISPPVPEEYADMFRVNGMLLPGYRIEGADATAKQEEQAAQEPQMEWSRRRRGR